MFGKTKVDGDEDLDENQLPPAPQLKLSEVLQAAESRGLDTSDVPCSDPGMVDSLRADRSKIPGVGPRIVEALRVDRPEIFAIGPDMTLIGKISSKGTLKIFGRVEGELKASVIRISDGAKVEGARKGRST